MGTAYRVVFDAANARAHTALEVLRGAKVCIESFHNPTLITVLRTCDGMMEVAVREFETGTVCDVEI